MVISDGSFDGDFLSPGRCCGRIAVLPAVLGIKYAAGDTHLEKETSKSDEDKRPASSAREKAV